MYELPRHRFLELKHFCLQYEEFRSRVKDICGRGIRDRAFDPTGERAKELTDNMYAIELIEMTARETDEEEYGKILQAVTRDISIGSIGVNRELLYKFYWLLSEKKGV